MTPSTSEPPRSDIVVVYDGECPFCTEYTRMLRLKALGKVELVNARDDHPIVKEIWDGGLNIDEGMVLKMDGHFYRGADCMNRLAMMSSESDLANKLHRWVFRRPRLSRYLYPY